MATGRRPQQRPSIPDRATPLSQPARGRSLPRRITDRVGAFSFGRRRSPSCIVVLVGAITTAPERSTGPERLLGWRDQCRAGVNPGAHPVRQSVEDRFTSRSPDDGAEETWADRVWGIQSDAEYRWGRSGGFQLRIYASRPRSPTGHRRTVTTVRHPGNPALAQVRNRGRCRWPTE